MAVINRLFLSVFSGDPKWASTKNRMYLVVNNRGVDEQFLAFATDRTRITDPGLGHLFVCIHTESDLRSRQGKTYQWDIAEAGIDTDDLINEYFRLGTTGSDAWIPRHAFVWGETDEGPVPLALTLDAPGPVLSTDFGEGVPSMPIGLVRPSFSDTPFDRLLLVAGTGGADDSESDSPFDVLILDSNDDVVESFRVAPDAKRHGGRSLIQVLDLSQTRTRNQLTRVGARVVVRAAGNDWWHPNLLAVFGMAGGTQPPMVPLAYDANMSRGGISTDPNDGTGAAEFQLQLVS